MRIALRHTFWDVVKIMNFSNRALFSENKLHLMLMHFFG